MLDLFIISIDNILAHAFGMPDWGIAENKATGEKEPWVNSSHEFVFGDNTSWTIGSGYTSNVFGPNIEFCIDPTCLLNLPAQGSLLTAFGASFLFGAPGYFSFKYGSERKISYGSYDFSLTRKRFAEQKFELTEEKYPRLIKSTNFLSIALMLSGMIAVRILHFRGFHDKSKSEGFEKANKIITDIVRIIEPTYLGFLHKAELIYNVIYKFEKLIPELKNYLAGIKTNLDLVTKESIINAQSCLNKLNFKERQISNVKHTKDDILEIVNKSANHISNQLKWVGQVMDLFQEDRATWYEHNTPFNLSCQTYELRANGKFEKDVAANTNNYFPGKMTFSTLLYKENAANKNHEISKQSDITFNPDSVEIKFDKKETKFILGHNGLDITCETGKSIQLRNTGDINQKHCDLHFNGNKIDLQCGLPATGPSLKMNGDENEIVLSVSTDTVGRSIRIAKDSISIGQTSDPQQVAKLPQIEITPAGINLTAGLSSISIGFADIEFKVGENKQKIDPISISEIAVMAKQQADMLAEIKNIIEKQKTQATALDQIQLKLQKS